MNFNSKQLKTIKFLLIIVVILLVLFTAYVFLGKKMIEGLDDARCQGGPPWSWNMSKSEAKSNWPTIVDLGEDMWAQPLRDPTCPPSTTTTTTTTTYDWSHVVNPNQYPYYVAANGITKQLVAPPYTTANVPEKTTDPVTTTDPETYNWTNWRALNSTIPETTLVTTYSYNASQPIDKQPKPWPGWPVVAALTTDPVITTDPVTYDWTNWRALNSTIPETTLVTTYSYNASQPINKQPNKWPGWPVVAALTTDPVVTYDWSNWLAINSGVSQATLIAYGYNTSKLITAQPNKWPGHPNLAPLVPGGGGAGGGGAGGGGTGATGANVYLLPSSFSARNSNYSLYGNNNLLEQQQRLLQQTQSQLQQSQLEQEQQRWQSRLQGQSPTEPVMNTNNVKGSSNAPKKKICYAPYKNEKDCESAGYLWDSMKEKCRKSDTNKTQRKDKSSEDTKFNSYNNDDKYILKTQIVPPVCPACPSYKCASEPQKLDNSILDQDTNNDLLTANNMILNERNFAKSIKTNDSGRFPMPLLADFSQFM
jgi:hypothetical protein